MKIYNLLLIQIVPFGNLEVDMAVPRGDGHNAGTKVRVNRLVFDNSGGYWSVNPFRRKGITMLVFPISLVIRVHHNVLVTEFCFRACRADLERAVLKGVKLGGFFFVYHFVVRDVSFQIRIPVDDSVAAVNQPVAVHFGKHFTYGTCQ